MVKFVQNQKLTTNEINSLLKKLDIEKYFKSNKVEYKEAGDATNPQFIVYECPFCKNLNYKGNEHPNRLYVGKANSKFRCYNCNEQGLFLKLAAKIENLSFRNLFDKYLGEGVFESLPEALSEFLDQQDEKRQLLEPIKEIEMPSEFEQLFERPQGKFKNVYEYMINRGMTAEGRKIYKNLDLRYCDYLEYKTPSGKIHLVQKRLIFPVYWENKLVGFQGRDITGEAGIKYYISEGLPKRRIIYNYENIKNVETITICEGIVDLIKCWSHNPICLFGSSISNEQLILLQSLPNLKNIILALDPDTRIPDKKYPNKPTKYSKIVDQLKPFWNVFEIEIPEGKDAGEYSFEEMERILNDATKYKEQGLTSQLK